MPKLIQMSDAKNDHLELLTWLRGIAAFLVLVSHTVRVSHGVYMPGDYPVRMFLFEALDLGDFGVALFFALSGCTLFLSYAPTTTITEVGHFYLKRIARIWPAYFVSLCVYIAFGTFFQTVYGPPSGNWIEFLSRDWGWRDVATYLTLTSNFIGVPQLFNTAYWSLPVEFQFYLLFPLAIFLLRWRSGAGIVLVCVVLYSIGWLRPWQLPDYRVFSMAYIFCGGILSGYFYKSSKVRLPFITTSSVFGIVLVFLSALWNKWVNLPNIHILGNQDLWLGLCAIFCVLLALHTTTPTVTIFSRFLSRYGEISYSIYLFHNIFMGLAVLVLLTFGITGVGKVFVVFSIASIGSFLIAEISYRYVERTFINLARYWVAKRRDLK